MTTVNKNVETEDRIDILVTAGSGATVTPGNVTNCVITPNVSKSSPFTYSISGFSGASYTASFTDEAAGALDVTGSVSASSAWTSDKEQFTMRGVYGSKSIDLKYSVVKSKDGQLGADGSDGDNGAGVNIVFTRSATDPGTPTPTPGVPTSQGWFDSPPAATDNSNFLWASQGIIIPPSTDYTWGATYKVDGSVFAEVTVYRKNNNTPPSAALTWDFTTNTLSAGDWSTSLPTVDTANDIIYASVGLFSGHPTDTATALDGSWSAVVKYAERVDGEDGEEGLKSLTGLVYLTTPSAGNPGTPTATNYVFSTVSFSGLTANWSLERPTITAGNANNYWESTFNAKENAPAGDVSSSSTSPPNLTFSAAVRVQDGFGDSVTESVTDINAAATKWTGVDLITFSQDSTNDPHPRSSTEYKYTYNATTGNLEYAVGASNTDKAWTTTTHTFLAGSTEVARIKLRHIAEPFEFSGIQQTSKVKSVYYEFEAIGTPGATYSTESNYTITFATTSFTQSWVGGGSPVANGYDQIQNYDNVADSGYLVSIAHTPSNALKTMFVSFSGIADSIIIIDGSSGGK